MENQTEPKRYNIKSFDQLINVVSVENFERIIVDFASSLALYLQAVESIKAAHPKFANKPHSKIARFEFVWIDDGKHMVEGINLHDTATGEVNHIPINKDIAEMGNPNQ